MTGYLCQYVYWKERVAPGQAIPLVGNAGTLMYVLGNLLTGKLNAGDPLDDTSESYTADLRFIINPRQFNHTRIMISAEGVRLYNSYVRRDLHETLLTQILTAKAYKVTETDVIYEFMREVGIDDMITFDALKKGQLRLRDSKKIPHFRSQKQLAG